MLQQQTAQPLSTNIPYSMLHGELDMDEAEEIHDKYVEHEVGLIMKSPSCLDEIVGFSDLLSKDPLWVGQVLAKLLQGEDIDELRKRVLEDLRPYMVRMAEKRLS